jgi:hypothetical protein
LLGKNEILEDLPLALLVARLALVDDVNAAAAADDLIVRTELFN